MVNSPYATAQRARSTDRGAAEERVPAVPGEREDAIEDAVLPDASAVWPTVEERCASMSQGQRALLDHIAGDLTRVLNGQLPHFPITVDDVRQHLRWALSQNDAHLQGPAFVVAGLRLIAGSFRACGIETGSERMFVKHEVVRDCPKVGMAMERLDETLFPRSALLPHGQCMPGRPFKLDGNTLWSIMPLTMLERRLSFWLVDDHARAAWDRFKGRGVCHYEIRQRFPDEVMEFIAQHRPSKAIRGASPALRHQTDRHLAEQLAQCEIDCELRVFNGAHYIERDWLFTPQGVYEGPRAPAERDPYHGSSSSSSSDSQHLVNGVDQGATDQASRQYVVFTSTLPRHFTINRITDFGYLSILRGEQRLRFCTPKQVAAHCDVGADSVSLHVPAYLLALD